MRHLDAPRTFILSFACLVFAGAIVLWLPISASGQRLTFINALFSSASAVCVTGLAVVDIGKDLSLFGQITTIVLFQVGGLGIITFSVLFFRMMGFGTSFKGREIIQSSFLHAPTRDFFVILKSVFWFTLVIESVGAMLLFVRFSADFQPGRAFYLAIYHSISAFNNCGYSLFSNSLENYKGDVIVNLTIIALILLGGIGFIVLHELLDRIRGLQRRLSLHARIVIITTVVLVAFGAILLFVFERNHVIREFDFSTKVLVALFQSVTARTCGFNTVEVGRLTNDSILLLIVLMFIGASPGSTGGGIKTSSAAVLWLLIWNRFKGIEEVSVANRTIPKETTTRTISIIFASAFSVALVTALLLVSAPVTPSPSASRHFFVEYLFEAVSAYGTVGLSMGVTSALSDFQKLVVALLMFAGRVGPLTLALSLSLQSGRQKFTYAEEPIMVG